MFETAKYAWEVLKTPLRFKEITAPSSVPSDTVALYAKDKSGTSSLYFKDDSDTEHDLSLVSSGAPKDADYLVRTANGTLTAERVVTDTTSIIWDWATAAQAKAQRAALTGDVTASLNDNVTTIASNAVTNTKLNDMAAWTVKARNNVASGDPQDVALADLTEEASPSAGDFLFAFDSTGALRKINWSQVSSGAGGGGGHLHGITRLVADGSTTTFNLLDFAEYIEGVFNDGIREDSLLYTLSADGSQVTLDNAPVDGNVIEFNYVVKGL